MNLRRTIVTLAAAATLAVSFAAPSVYAEDSQGVSATAKELGDFSYSMGAGSMSFTTAQISTTQTTIVQSTDGQVSFNDTHSYNEAPWSLSMQLQGDLETEDGDYYIEAENFRVWERAPSPSSSLCTLEVDGSYPEVGGNEYQHITRPLPTGPNDRTYTGVVTTAKGVPLSTQQPVLSATDGRGCGAASIDLYYQLTVPAGTYTGGGSAVYTGEILLSNTLEPEG